MVELSRNDALLMVDIQNDFLPGGQLAVAGGDQIIPSVNQLIHRFRANQLSIYASRDWHPEDHISFKSNGGIWPIHCVRDTVGAEFSKSLCLPYSMEIISKGTEVDRDAYSAFNSTVLTEKLRSSGVSRLVICGLATDYCVLYTVRDALDHGFEVLLVEDAICAVDVQEGDGIRAIQEMRLKGAQLIHSSAIIEKIHCSFEKASGKTITG